MKKVIAFFAYFCIIFSFTNCSKSSFTAPSENEAQSIFVRLSFSSEVEFLKAIESFHSGKNTNQINIPANFYSLKKRISEYRSKDQQVDSRLEDLLKFDFPDAFLNILNKDGEVIIGDKIVWFQEGKRLEILVKDENKLIQFRENLGLVENQTACGPIEIKSAQNVSLDAFNLGINNGDARNQFEFFQQFPVSGRRKYVHELSSFVYSYSGGGIVYWSMYLSIKFKLEWSSTGSRWRTASELRDIELNLLGSAYINFAPSAQSYQVGPSISRVESFQGQGDIQRGLAQLNGSGTFGNAYWTINLYGSIAQQVVGDVPQNKWINSGTQFSPLW